MRPANEHTQMKGLVGCNAQDRICGDLYDRVSDCVREPWWLDLNHVKWRVRGQVRDQVKDTA